MMMIMMMMKIIILFNQGLTSVTYMFVLDANGYYYIA